MKKEIEITFVCVEGSCYSNKIYIELYVNNRFIDKCILTEHEIKGGLLNSTLAIFDIEEHTLEQYLSIPEIKALYDEHFKKEFDLFSWFDKNEKEYYYINHFGKVTNKYIFSNGDYSDFKQNYNFFPTEELCEKARPMSLDERKQLLFANAKGYETLTHEENYNNMKETYYLFKGKNNLFEACQCYFNYTFHIYFATREHAQECANFMNETEEVSE